MRRILWAALAWLPLALSAAQVLPAMDVPVAAQSLQNVKEVESDSDEFQEYSATLTSLVSTPYEENNSIPLTVFKPREVEGPVPFVIVLHYWGASNLNIERTLCAELAHRRIGSVIMTLPYHLGRAPKGTRSGELAIQPDLSKLKSMMTQAVLDVRLVFASLTSLPYVDGSRISIAGTSLGALVAANAYALEPSITGSAFIVGGIDLAHILWNSSRVVAQRDQLRSQGYTEARVRDELKSIEPATYLPRRTAGRSLVIGGRFDTVVPAVDTHKLIDLLPNCQSIWLDTGHYGGIFIEHRILKEAANFLDAVSQGTEFKAPHTLIAPTLRICATGSTIYPLELGAGIDLLATPRRDIFSTAILTPRGPRLWLGARLDKSISIGVYGATSRVGFGVMWSTVL